DFSREQLAEIKEVADGRSMPDLARDLLNASDPDKQIEEAKKLAGPGVEPSPEHISAATEHLAQHAVTPFLKVALRRRILEIRQQNEQTIDRHSIDEALYSGFDAASLEKAQTRVTNFRDWIEKNRNEFTALQILYSGTKPLRISMKSLRQLKD